MLAEKDEREAWIRMVSLEMEPPSLQDNRADTDRFLRSLKEALGGEAAVELDLMKRLPSVLREHRYQVRGLVYEYGGIWNLMDVLPAVSKKEVYGVALDIGTSTVVLRLIGFERGEIVGEKSFPNPQIEIGPDILTRIHFASREGGLDHLRKMLVGGINREIAILAGRNGIQPQAIAGIAAAGNTTMTHLFLGLDPYWLCREPYIPVVNRPGILRAGQLGLEIHPGAPVLVFPNVGSYLGGDVIAGILASGMAHQEEVSILVDVGTNAEVVLGNRDWLMGCAGAAGPALEGGVASIGMMAGPGAISRVRIDPVTGAFTMKTIEGRPPVGICGSGLIDLTAELFLAGMIDVQGKLVRSTCGERFREIDGISHVVLVFSRDSGTGEDLTLSQADIDSLIRSKAAMYTILVTITRMVHLDFKDIVRYDIAGVFGTHIDPRSAITLGMIPDLPPERYRSLGNTSLEGASMALQQACAREDMDYIRERVTYVELNVNQEFMNRFSAAKFIPHTEAALFPSVKARGSFFRKGRG